MPSKPPHAPSCTFHCAACDAHFHSLEAFDVHRQFLPGHHGDWRYRTCCHPLDDERQRFTILGEGRCLARGTRGRERIWTLRRKLETGFAPAPGSTLAAIPEEVERGD